MKKIFIALLLALTVAAAYAGPAYFNEQRVPLTVKQVRCDSRYAEMAFWFGQSRDVFQTHEGCVENLPEGANGKFRWGQCMDKPYEWACVTPEESAQMPGVTFELGNGFFLHCQKGCGGNAIVFYGKCVEVIVGPAGQDGAPGLKGDKGDRGDRGLRGFQGPPGQTVCIPAPAPICNYNYNYNISYSIAPLVYGSASMMGIYGATYNSIQLMGVCTTSPTRINIRNSATGGSATGGAGGAGGNATATGGTGGSVGPITNNNSNSNSNVNTNNNVINVGDGSATGHASGDGSATSNSGK